MRPSVAKKAAAIAARAPDEWRAGLRRRPNITVDEKLEVLRLRVEERKTIGEIVSIMKINQATVGEIVKEFPLSEEEGRGRRARTAAKMRSALKARGNYIGGDEWTAEEDSILTKAWKFQPQERIEAALPGRSWRAISRRASTILRLRRDRGSIMKRGRGSRVDPLFAELREIRKARGVTQQELADRMGIQHLMLGRYELGDTRPGWLRLRDWLDALGYDLRPIPKNQTERARGSRPWIVEEEELLCELTQQGSTVPEIALALRRPAPEVEKRLLTLGLLESERTRGVSGMMKARLG